VTHVHRETLGSALDLSIDALLTLGMDERRARRAAEIFKEYDEAAVREMALIGDDEEAYASSARKHTANLERALHADALFMSESAEAGEDKS
jgi:hypothetical protein